MRRRATRCPPHSPHAGITPRSGPRELLPNGQPPTHASHGCNRSVGLVTPSDVGASSAVIQQLCKRRSHLLWFPLFDQSLGRPTAHALSHPSVSWSTGTSRSFAPFPLWTSSIPFIHLISLGASLTPDSMKKAPYGYPPHIGPSLGEAPERFSQTPTWCPLVDVLRTLDWEQDLLAAGAAGA